VQFLPQNRFLLMQHAGLSRQKEENSNKTNAERVSFLFRAGMIVRVVCENLVCFSHLYKNALIILPRQARDKQA
jgi:tRNA(Phe) wybutosine-synthesizing methylase Tyw3